MRNERPSDCQFEALADDERLDAIFSEFNRCDEPGVCVGVAIGGTPVYRRGFGLANVELSVALSPSMRLRLGSVSKQFTCLAYLLLCEAGLAHIDTLLGDILPEVPPHAAAVTMREIMGNVSGLRDVYDILQEFSDPYDTDAGPAKTLTSTQLFEFFCELGDVNMPIASGWAYNNGNWLVLTTVIERLAGKPLEDVLDEQIFRPLNMVDSLLLRLDSRFVPNRASQHVADGRGAFKKLYWGVDNYVGGGAIVSTIDDMLKWLDNMARPRIGSAKTWQAMTRPQLLKCGNRTGYGLGLFLDTYRGARVVTHSGSALGGNAQALLMPQADLAVVIITNRQDISSSKLMYRVVDACVEGLAPPPRLGTGPIATGVYHSRSSGRTIELADLDGVQMVTVDGLARPFGAPDPDGTLWDFQSWTDPREFVRLADDAVLYSDFGNLPDGQLDRLERIELPGEFDAAPFVGCFESLATHTRADISLADEGALRLVARGRFGEVGFRLTPLGLSIFRAKLEKAPLIEGLHGGVVTFCEHGFDFSNYSSRRVRFQKCE